MNPNNRQKTDDKRKEELDFYNDLYAVASATEFTGLMPTPPESQQQLESYRDIYNSVPDDKQKKKRRSNKNEKEKLR